MAGFLETLFGSPEQTMALGLLGANLMAGQGPQGFLAAQQHLAGAEDRKLKRGLLEMQAENYKSEMEQRKAAMAKQQQIQDAVAGLLGGSKPAPAAPGQMGSGSFGVIPAPAGQPDMPQPRGGLSGASLEQIAGLHALGGPNLMDAYKFAREGIERKPGSFYEDMQGRRTYVADPVKGINFDGQRITTIPGFTDFTTAQTLAQEAPKALLGAAGRLNLRDNPDGTKSPVSELSENPTLQGVLSQLMGGPAPAASAPAPTVARPASGMTPEQAAGRVETLQGEMRKAVQMASAATTPEERQRAQNDINALTRELQVAGARPSVTAAPGIGYGKTTAQATAEEAARTQAVEQAKADVMPGQQRRAAMDSANYMYNLLDTAIKHPGRETATGMSGTLDPRNYLPATNATNFKAMLDQIKGSAFLQAFQSLKGGGQITEVEGKKATDAIARLNTAQSDEEFKNALIDFQDVIGTGIKRMGGDVPNVRGTSGPGVFSDAAKEQRYQAWKRSQGK